MKFTIAAILLFIAFGFMIAVQGELPDLAERIALGIVAGGVEAVAMICVVMARSPREDGKIGLGFAAGVIGLIASCVVYVLAQDLTSTPARYGVVAVSGMFQGYGFVSISQAMRRGRPDRDPDQARPDQHPHRS